MLQSLTAFVLVAALGGISSGTGPDPLQGKQGKQVENPIGECGCWTNKQAPYSAHWPRYSIQDDSGYEDFACNIGPCVRVSETQVQLQYWRAGSGSAQMLLAPAIRCLPLKGPLDVVNEARARREYTLARSDSPVSLDLMEEGLLIQRISDAAERKDTEEVARLEAEYRTLTLSRLQRAKAALESLRNAGTEPHGVPPPK